MSIFVANVISTCLASSVPWSQVSDFRRCSGSVLMVAKRPSRTAVALWSSGRWTSIVYRVWRSTKVAIAERQFDPKIKSPSQCPGTVSYTHLRAHETDSYLVCRLLLEKKKKQDNL